MTKLLPQLLLLSLLLGNCQQESGPLKAIADVPKDESGSHVIIRENGDTVLTGVPIKANGKRIDPELVAKPKTSRLIGTPVLVPAQTNVQPAGPPRIIPVPAQLNTITPGKNGVPLPKVTPALPKVWPVIQPVSVPASTPTFKDAATKNIQYMGIEHGLRDPNIHSLLEDHRGNIWFGGPSGVTCYDGLSFTHYTTANGLINGNSVESMLEDRRGNIWFAGDQGLTYYDGVRFIHFTTQEGLISNRVWCLLEDSQGNLWIGSNKGVSRYDGHNFTHFTTKEGLSGNHVLSILEDSRGDMWFGTGGQGVNRYDGKSFVHFTTKEGLPFGIVRSIIEDSRGKIWFGTYGEGVSCYDPGKDSIALFTTNEGLASNAVTIIMEDSQGHLWFSVGGGPAVTHYDGVNFTHFTTKEGMSSNTILSMLEDSGGNLWFGTIAGGVSCYNRSRFEYFTERNGLITNPIRSMLEDSRGNMWFGTFGGGVTQYEPAPGGSNDHFIQHHQGNRFSNGLARSILEDSRGNLWFGAFPRGVVRYPPPNRPGTETGVYSFTPFTAKDGLISNFIFSMLEDSRGNIWFGTQGEGLSRFDGKSFVNFTADQDLISNKIAPMLEDRFGNVWFANGSFGLSCYDGINFTHFSTKEGLKSNVIQSMLEDSRGNLWVGSDHGLSLYLPADPDNYGEEKNIGNLLAHYTVEEGLTDNSVVSIIEGKQLNIWISTRRGITALVPRSTQHAHPVADHYQVFTFSRPNRLKQSGFTGGNVCLDRYNRIWWGSNEGLTRLDLNQFKFSSAPPSISLKSVEVHRTFIDYRRLEDSTYRHNLTFGEDLWDAFDSVPPFYNYPLRLSLPHPLNYLTFQFVSIDWAAPASLKYSYFLEGLDNAWSPPTPENKTEYRNLAPGKYTLKVKAIGAAHIWSEVFEYDFRVLPPWWLSWWAYAIYGTLILSMLFGLRAYELRRYRTQFENRRLKELDTFKTRLYTNITHEFRTPLTIILGMAQRINEDPKKWYTEGMRMIIRNGRQLLGLVNQMLDASKLDKGKLTLKFQCGEIMGFMHYLTQSFESFAAGKNIQLHFLKEIDRLEMDYDPVQLTKVVSNLLSNAIKFTPEGGQIYLIVRRKAEENGIASELLEIRVKDTGVGITPEALPYIFDRFYQPDSSTNRGGEGTGLGLALTKELVKLMGGTIAVQSKLGEGTDFCVVLPVSRTAPKAESLRSLIERPEPDAINSIGMVNFPPGEEYLDTQKMETDVLNGKDLPVALLIEDNRDVLTYIASCLEGRYQLEFALDGQDGTEKALEIVPDIIISDIMMPKKDGLEVCATLKEDIRTSHIPLILLTAKADRDAKLKGLKAGADAYLAKPFDQEELDIRLEKLLDLRRRLQIRYSKLSYAGLDSTQSLSREELFLINLRETIEEHLSDESFGIAQLCVKIGLSRSQLHNKLKALTGQSTSIYIRTVRLEKAKELLLNTNLDISEIAYEVGFRTPLYFTQIFSKEVGVAPSVFRKNG